MMHTGWEAERALWEDTTSAACSVLDVGNALTHLEDWIALDYAPGSDVRLSLAFSCVHSLRGAPQLFPDGLHISEGVSGPHSLEVNGRRYSDSQRTF